MMVPCSRVSVLVREKRGWRNISAPNQVIILGRPCPARAQVHAHLFKEVVKVFGRLQIPFANKFLAHFQWWMFMKFMCYRAKSEQMLGIPILETSPFLNVFRPKNAFPNIPSLKILQNIHCLETRLFQISQALTSSSFPNIPYPKSELPFPYPRHLNFLNPKTKFTSFSLLNFQNIFSVIMKRFGRAIFLKRPIRKIGRRGGG